MKRKEGWSVGDHERDQRVLKFCCGAWQRQLRGGKGRSFSGSIGREDGMYMQLKRSTLYGYTGTVHGVHG